MICLEDAKKALHGVKILEQSINICEIRVKVFVKSDLRSTVRQGRIPWCWLSLKSVAFFVVVFTEMCLKSLPVNGCQCWLVEDLQQSGSCVLGGFAFWGNAGEMFCLSSCLVSPQSKSGVILFGFNYGLNLQALRAVACRVSSYCLNTPQTLQSTQITCLGLL